jgi:hypothetical protein
MRRYLLAVAPIAALVALVLVNNTAAGLVAAPPQPGQLAITSPVVLTGKITSIEKDTVEAAQPFPGAKDKQQYKIAVVKIADGLSGIDQNKVTHIRIGFIPPAPQPVPPPPDGGIRPVRPIRPGFAMPELKEGQERLFFLAKHPTADFYLIPGMAFPVDIATDAGKKQLEEVKKVTTLLADPMKGLKSDKAEVRSQTAALVVMKYRAYPAFGGEVEHVAIPAEESKLILKGLADGDWKPARFDATPNALTAFNMLGLTDKDGWTPPKFARPVPGQPVPDFGAIQKDAFVKWLAGPGKDYQIKKVVPKTAEK